MTCVINGINAIQDVSSSCSLELGDTYEGLLGLAVRTIVSQKLSHAFSVDATCEITTMIAALRRMRVVAGSETYETSLSLVAATDILNDMLYYSFFLMT